MAVQPKESVLSARCDPFQQQLDLALCSRPVHQAIHQLYKRAFTCISSRECLLVWHVVHLALMRSVMVQSMQTEWWPADWVLEINSHVPQGFASMLEAASLQTGFHARRESLNFLSSPRPNQRDYRLPSPAKSAILVHYFTESSSEAEEIHPFLDLLACLASRQGMDFVLDRSPHLEIHWQAKAWAPPHTIDRYLQAQGFAPRGGNFSRTLVRFVERWLDKGGGCGLHGGEDTHISEPAMADEQWLLRLSQPHFWNMFEQRIGIVGGNPYRWAKIWAIEAALRNREAVIYFDYDVTVRPDCMGAVHLLDELFAPEEPGGPIPHIVLRDSSPHVDCLNSGFLALRNSSLARRFLGLWKERAQWPGMAYADQGALGEALLHLLDVERAQRLGTTEKTNTYRCVVHLLPTSAMETRWRDYCECFQSLVSKMIGDFGERNSSLVRFVNPRHFDVNYLPNSFTDHWMKLDRMRLLPWRPDVRFEGSSKGRVALPPVTPFVVHWAGIAGRTALMRQYLIQRFGVPSQVFLPGQSLKNRCAAVLPLSPRVKPECTSSLGGAGTHFETVYHPWHYASSRTLRNSTHDAAALALFNFTLRSLQTEPAATGQAVKHLPDRAQDQFTASSRFRADLLALVGGPEAARNMVVVELGTYLGYTTRFLAEHFRAVVSVEKNPSYFVRAQALTANLENVKLIMMDTLLEEWDPLQAAAESLGGAELVLLDTDHTYEPLLSDLSLALFGQLGPGDLNWKPRFLVLDGFYEYASAVQASHEFVVSGWLRQLTPVGESEAMAFAVSP